ncbi:MAG TPA: terpene synthase family protein [Anaerolineae bacterium]|nr:terpene synthase family protein [Anaerolineae bacterium]
MTGGFFATLNAEEKRQIAETTDTLVKLLKDWVPHYPILRPTRIPMAALSTAMAFASAVPRLPAAEYLPLSKMTLWIFGVDDITDERSVSLSEIQRKADNWYSIARDGTRLRRKPEGRDELTTILREIRDELAKAQLFEPLHEQWASSLRDVLEGILREYRYGQAYTAHGAQTLPILDEYVHYGRCSIGVPLWGLTVLIIQGDPAAKENFELASEAIHYAGAAIRLYNDLQSYGKEVLEGNINSVIIIENQLRAKKDPPATAAGVLAEAKQVVLQLADFYAQKCYDLTEQVQAGSRQFQEAIARTVAFHAYFYQAHDYHLTSLADIYTMFDGQRP